MKDQHILTEMEQVKALADPLRTRVLEALCQKPMTTKQVALQLGEKPTKLYHHVEILERAGLVQLVETRPNRGTVEKYYQAVARQFALDRKLLAAMPGASAPGAEIADLFTNALEETINEIRESAEAGLLKPQEDRMTAILSRGQVCATKEQMDRLLQTLQAWLEECRTANDQRGAAHYRLTIAFYPVKNPKKRKVKNTRKRASTITAQRRHKQE